MSIVPVMIASNAAAAAQASARTRVLAPFKQAGATGPDTAIDWRPDGPDRQTADALIRAGVIKELRPGRYWYDPNAEAMAHQGARKILVLIVGGLVLLGLVLLVIS